MNTNQKVTKNILKTVGYTALLTVSLTLGMHYAQAVPLQSNKVYGFKQNQNEYEQLDAALAPIALYPDSLLTHIFIASTYPLEVIEAARFIQQHPNFNVDDYEQNGLDKETIETIQDDALAYGWDASVVALTAFPDILNNMSDDLSWLSDLGDAFEADQELVLNRVQKLRELAYDQGNLQNDEQVEVLVEKQENTRVIVIQPRRQEVVYVPYYDTASIFGPSWHIRSSYRWTRPYYARHYHHDYVYFSPAAYIGSRLLFGGIHWSNRHISIHRDWTYRNARNYRYRNTHHKRVHHREYQRWNRATRNTRHDERQSYVGNTINRKTGEKFVTRNKWVSNKHSEFSKVQRSNKQTNKGLAHQSKSFEKATVKRKDKWLDRNTEKQRQASKPQRNFTKQQRQVSMPKHKIAKQQRQVSMPKPKIAKQQRQVSMPKPKITQQQRQVSTPQPKIAKQQRQVSKPQRKFAKQQRHVSKPQRQKLQRTNIVKR